MTMRPALTVSAEVPFRPAQPPLVAVARPAAEAERYGLLTGQIKRR